MGLLLSILEIPGHLWSSYLQGNPQNFLWGLGGLLPGSWAAWLKALFSSFSSNRVATNQKVREQVRLELSFVNSDLQMLKEELEGLNISVGVYQNTE